MKQYFELVWTFIKIGASTFGGGYAMIPVLERELIKKKGWITMDEVMDYYTIAQVTPGIIAVNVSTFVGYKLKGVFGGIIATVSFIIPGVLLMIVISAFVRRFADYAVVRHAFAGIRVAVGALILDTVIKLCRGVFRDFRAAAIFVIALVLSAALNASPVYIVTGAGLAGLLLYSRKAGPGDGSVPGGAP
ncbi:MAG: chromate transporter [Treponema sp.]|nr:chromate transporter [Treponema sp.]